MLTTSKNAAAELIDAINRVPDGSEAPTDAGAMKQIAQERAVDAAMWGVKAATCSTRPRETTHERLRYRRRDHPGNISEFHGPGSLRAGDPALVIPPPGRPMDDLVLHQAPGKRPQRQGARHPRR